MNLEKLKKWIVDNRIEERTIEGFWKCIDGCRNDTGEEIGDILNSINDCLISLQIKKVAFAIIYDYSEFVEAELSINYKDKFIGSYVIAFTLLGDVADDRLKFEGYSFIRKLIAIEERNEEIARLALDAKLDIETVQRITGLNLQQIIELQ